ncbi:pyruvate kinase [Frigidibacter oleivorans]|uniref:pyruvate kinase n=1 Tax=Frigidibacter oleivorans TaxID=2487129 RepID=UPI000F8C771B|nr:pyruvate kinase [Frigidibacter oleivorans]
MDGARNEAWGAGDLLDRLRALQDDVEAAVARRLAGWVPAPGREEFRSSAANLARYLALRQHDLRGVQRGLATLGLSSLGRAEAHVAATLAAVVAALARIDGARTPPAFPDPGAFAAPAAELARRSAALFGPQGDGPRSRILVTLPSEAAETPALLRDLVAAGAGAVRINTAHDGAEAWAAMIAHLRAAEAEFGRKVPVSMDLAGPKIRIAGVDRAEGLRLKPGDRFGLALHPAAVPQLPVALLSHAQLFDHMPPGQPVWINDGKLRAEVTERPSEGSALLTVTGARAKGEKLKPEKGVNLPGADLSIPALTDEDRANLPFVAEHADIVSFSFVQTAADVDDLVAALAPLRAGRPLPAIMLKIETPLAVRNLPDLILRAGGAAPVAVMIARGDLAVEIGFERLSEMQEEILWLCEAAQVPAVWATQVLEGLVKDGQASRAETTDAAMGQRAECVMLNKGPHLVEAVGFLRGILLRMDRHQDKKFAHLGPLGSWTLPE